MSMFASLSSLVTVVALLVATSSAAAFERVDLDGDRLDPWARPTVGLKGALRKMDGTPFEANLVPLDSTILRRTTFPITEKVALEATKKHKIDSFGDGQDPIRDF